jgi:hypothetical protein
MNWQEIRRAVRERQEVSGDGWVIVPSDRDLLLPSIVEWQVGQPNRIVAGWRTYDDSRVDFFAGRLAFTTPLFTETARQAEKPGQILLSIGDNAATRGVAFCSDHPADVLIPDTVFILTRGYADRRSLHAKVAWQDRERIAFWRGASTGFWTTEWRHIQRIALSRLSLSHPDLIDAGISKVGQLPAGADEELLREGLLRAYVGDHEFVRYRYQIDVDGNTNAWAGLFVKLLTGSPVLKVASPRGFRQWYYDRLIPWENFIPVEADMSDMPAKVRWLLDHDDEARAVGTRGLSLALSLTWEGELRDGARRVIEAA